MTAVARPGIIGLAVETNIVYYRIVQSAARAIRPDHDLPISLDTVDFAAAVRDLRSGDRPAFVEHICGSARRLAAGGADFLVISSNTSHLAVDAVEQEIGLPVLDIRDVAAQAAENAGFGSVGLVATSHTLEASLFDEHLATRGIEVVTPSSPTQASIDSAIFDELVHGRVDGRAPLVIAQAIDELRAHADGVLLACTDLTHLAAGLVSDDVLDTTSLHGRTAAMHALGVESAAGSGQDGRRSGRRTGAHQ